MSLLEPPTCVRDMMDYTDWSETNSVWKSGPGICSCSLMREGTGSRFYTGDGTGLWSCAKRLERGRFSWPVAEEQSDRVMLSHEELSLLLGGIDLTRTRRKNWYGKTVLENEKV